MAENDQFFTDSVYDKKVSFALNIFWAGFVIYSGSFALSTSFAVNFKICQVFQILGILLFVPAAIYLIQWKFDNLFLKIVFSIYCLWLLIVLFRGFAFTYERLKFMLFDAEFGLFLYFVPLIFLFPKNLEYYKKIFNVIIILGILFILYDILFRDNLLNLDYRNTNTKFTFEYFTKSLSLPSGFILLTFVYHSNRKKLLALVVVLVSITFAIIRARRAMIFMSSLPLIISYVIFLYADKRKLLIILFSILLGTLMGFYAVKIYLDHRDDAFGLITGRMSEDTRSGVEEYFYRDMTTRDWIIGKGFYGQYYCPGIDINGITGYRGMIETDYLNIILKGGIISLGLLLLIAVPAMFKGIFYSKNLLSKAAGFWIFVWLASLYPATVNTFTMNHLLVWISIGICYSKDLRNLPEIVVREKFLGKL